MLQFFSSSFVFSYSSFSSYSSTSYSTLFPPPPTPPPLLTLFILLLLLPFLLLLLRSLFTLLLVLHLQLSPLTHCLCQVVPGTLTPSNQTIGCWAAQTIISPSRLRARSVEYHLVLVNKTRLQVNFYLQTEAIPREMQQYKCTVPGISVY